jgi:hypothetical protein
MAEPDSPVMEVQLPKSEGTGKDKEGYAKITQAAWGPLNQTIITSNEDGSLRVYDTEVRLFLHCMLPVLMKGR